MKNDLVQFDQALRKADLPRQLLLLGEEEYQLRSALERFEKAWQQKVGEFERYVLRPAEVDADKLHNLLSTPSLFQKVPLVILRDAEKLHKNVQEQLVQMLQGSELVGILVLEFKKLDQRTKFAQVLKQRALLLECKPLYANQIPAWISTEIRRFNKQISQDAARYLADIMGTELGQIAQALERLCLYVGERKLIELADVEKTIAESSQRTLFELTDAIGNRDMARALKMLSNVLEQGEAPVRILGMVARHMRILLKAKELHGRMLNQTELASYLGVHPFFAQQYQAQAKGYQVAELREAFAQLSECDRELKSSRVPREFILERLVHRFCAKKKAA